MSLLSVSIEQAGYAEKKQCIENIVFTVEPGELIGLIGSNGAGKSTTIKAILGLLEHINGDIMFEAGANYSYIPERPIFYNELTLWEHLDFIAAVEGLDDQVYKKYAEQLLDLYKLTEVAHHFPSTYSKGMQQKAMLILSLIIRPSIYLIDEPFVGLDPDAMKWFLKSIQSERERGAGMIMSTHVLDTAERVCDRFLLVHKGKLAAQGTLAEIQEQCRRPNGSLYDCFHAIAEANIDE